VRLGVHIGYWGLGLSAAEQLALVQEAERLGYASVWTAEAYGSDCVTILGWIAAQTETIGLGTAIMQMPGRSAAMTAMTAATLDQLSSGRFLLGIGHERPAGRRGLARAALRPPAPAHARVRRRRAARALARARGLRGRDAAAPAARRAGQGAEAHDRARAGAHPDLPRRDRPEEHALAAEIADGWIPTLFSPEHVAEFRPLLEEGFARAAAARLDGLRHRADVQRLRHRRRRAARDAMRPFLALYVGGMGSRKQNFYNQLVRATGSRTPRARSRTSTSTASRRRPRRALPGELIDAVSLCGPRDVVRERLRVLRAGGWSAR
jgi:alkanesulfonate monooxygenase SsuD/methylene tetrahydromethanopterin reductase-like flavin-dependent oxidoreductase (luciferase family)